MKLFLWVCVLFLSMSRQSLGTQKTFSEDYFTRYSNASVWRFTPVNEREAVTFLHVLESLHLDVWLSSLSPSPLIDVLFLDPHHFNRFRQEMSQAGSSWSVSLLSPSLFVDKVEEKMKTQIAPSLLLGNFSDPESMSWFLSYHTYDEITAYMQTLAADYPDLVTLISIGKTVNGNNIQGVSITRGRQAGKQKLIFTGCIHAREWISAATMQYLMHWLVTLPQPHSFIDTYEWIIVPVTNVDGYLWTWSNDRMWRKNRRKQKTCYGVDNNRNFEYQWGTGGSSSLECADNYKGPLPASEPETVAVQNYITSAADVIVYADVHAYGQLWMTPWGWTSSLPPTQDYNAQMETSKLITDAIYNTHGRQYTIGPIATTIYPASGCSSDFSYGVKNVVLSYAVELRGTSSSQAGFLLPPEEIIPQGEEFVAGVSALMQWIADN